MTAFGTSFGPVLIGGILNATLYGAAFMQYLDYWITLRRDWEWLRATVFLLFIVDTLDTIFEMATLFDYFTPDSDTAKALLDAYKFGCISPLLTALAGCTVQLFFGFRVKRLTGNKWLTFVIMVLAIVHLVGGIGTTTGVYWVGTLDRLHSLTSIILIWMVVAATNDVLITLSLVYYLRKQTIGFVAIDNLITKIIRMTIQTGLLTTICAGSDTILFLSLPKDNNIHLMFSASLCKLYTISLMSNLNARTRWEQEDQDRNPRSGPQLSSVKFNSMLVPNPGEESKDTNAIDTSTNAISSSSDHDSQRTPPKIV